MSFSFSFLASQLRNAQKLGGIPIYFSEYWMPNVNWFAGGLAVACNEGCNATTYWQPLGRIQGIRSKLNDLKPAMVGVDMYIYIYIEIYI